MADERFIFNNLLFICFIQLGAAAVNLVAGEKPADVYSGIAAR
jgi:DNA-directed RNA polymerase